MHEQYKLGLNNTTTRGEMVLSVKNHNIKLSPSKSENAIRFSIIFKILISPIKRVSLGDNVSLTLS